MKYRNRRAGIFLIQIAIVLALSALVTMLVINNYGIINQLAVRHELEALMRTCVFLQQRAMTRGQSETLLFNTGQNTYTYDNEQYTLPTNVCFGILPGVHGPPSAPHKPLTAPITFEGQRITFFSDGIISAGLICLTDINKRYMYALSVGISQVSYLRKYRYNGAWSRLS